MRLLIIVGKSKDGDRNGSEGIYREAMEGHLIIVVVSVMHSLVEEIMMS
jgi:hypothetical protein